MPRVIVIGYGNPGRKDDGLGPELVRRLENVPLKDVTLDSDYQLMVEDAYNIARHDKVIFIDADINGPEPFYFKKINPSKAYIGFSSHSVSPAVLLNLSEDLFNRKVEGYIMGIRGYTFNEFGEGLSPGAQKNLEEALKSLEKLLGSPEDFKEIRAELVSNIKIDN